MTEPRESSSPPAASMRLSPALIVIAIIPILGLIAAVGLLLSERGQPPEATSQPARVGSLNQPLPEFTLTTLDGQPVDLELYRGRPIFMNFWGTWCPPCVAELPELQAFAAAQGEQGALIVASNNSESAEQFTATSKRTISRCGYPVRARPELSCTAGLASFKCRPLT